LNLTNKHSKTHAGFVNEKALGIQDSGNGGITLITKKAKSSNKPASSQSSVSFGSNKPARKVYKTVASHSKGYRDDLIPAAVQRASAVKYTQKTKRDLPAKKPRGAKANKVEA